MTAWLPLIPLLVAWAGATHAAEPRIDYMIHCMGCHLDDGRGHPPDVPDLRGEMGRMLQVPGGRPYLVQVPGAAQAPVSDAALAAIVNYMLVTFSAHTLPDDFEPITAAEVAQWRPDWVHDVMPVRARLLEAIAALPD